jgi:hypothetical protein
MQRLAFPVPLMLPAAALALLTLLPDGREHEASAQPPKTGTFVKFDDHLKHLQQAQHEQYVGKPGVKVASKAHFNEMKAHLNNMYKNLKVSHTFVGHGGHHIDCVSIDQQPSLRHPALKNHKVQHTPPPLHFMPKHVAGKKQPATHFVPRHLAKGMKDAHGHEMYTPPGTIPLRRLTLTELTKFRTLKDYFKKHHNGVVSAKAKKKLPAAKTARGDTSIHRYAIATQTVDNYGGCSWLNIWSPQPPNDQFSLTQHWYTGGDPVQTIEGGWQVYPAKYGHNNPVLFIYWTADDYNNTGAYNLDSPGFIQTNNSWVIGGAWSPVSTTGGAQYGFRLAWNRDPATGNWWLYIQGTSGQDAVGYYPRELYGTGQMSRNATDIEYGGEVTGQPTSGPMGSGAFANTGWQNAAFHKEIYYFPTTGGSSWANLTGYQTNANLYTVDVHNTGGGDWGTYFFFGGPGGG